MHHASAALRATGRDLANLLADVKRLAAEYYVTTGRPLGVTGEIAELEAASKLDLELAEARAAGYDATRLIDGRVETVQIKGRRVASRKTPYRGRMPSIGLKKPFDVVVLVLLDEAYEPVEMWEATREAVTARLTAPGSKSRNERGAMGLSQFKSIATKVWPRSTGN